MDKNEEILSKYLDYASNKLEDIYYALRLAFIREGWTEKDLEKPPYYPNDIMLNFQRFSDEQSRLFFEVKDLLGIDWGTFTDYIMVRLQKINEKTPLENVD
jgi:hypothetical protein